MHILLLKEKLILWLRNYTKHVYPLKSADIHLDQLLDNWDDVDTIFQILPSIIIEAMSDSEIDLDTYRVLFVIPLKSSSKLDVSPPRIPLSQEDLDVEPSSIYVVHNLNYLYYSNVEEYKYPIYELYSSMNGVNAVVYYRVFRYKMGIEKDWEYSRCFYFEFLKDRFVVD